MGYLLTKVVIDGVTIRDDSDENALSYLINWEYERTGTSQISELDLKVLKSTTNDITLSVGKSIQIWKGFTTSTDVKVFDGYISEYEPDGGLINITAKDKLWDLIRKNVNKVYEISGPQAGQISEIAKDLIETYGGLTSDVVATGLLDTETIDEFRCVHTDIFERLKVLADAVSYQFWYDAENDTVHFEPIGYNDGLQTLTVGEEIIGVPTWTNDTSSMVNDLRVDGAVSLTQIRKPIGSGNATIGTTADFTTTGILLDKTPDSVELIVNGEVKTGGTKDASTGHYYYVDKENKTIMPTTGTTFPEESCYVNYTWYAPGPIHQINQESIDTYGLFEKQKTLSDITTIADAEVRTTEILSRFSQPFLCGNLLIKSSSDISVNFGDTVTIIDNVSRPTINQLFVVTSQVLKYPGTSQELTVGNEGVKLADWQIDVNDRLNRIEESLSLSNQDLILELIDIKNQVQTIPRYKKVQTANIAGDSLIWGSEVFGVWNVGKWASTTAISFVLGNSSAAILGTSLLGSQTSEPVDHYIQQYLNEYSEEFIDEDFKADNTTATWIGGTFTSGQVLESDSIDFNNGTITQVTLTATVSSGSFTYEVTANGTDWETTTSGTLHTFTKTGTDLRFRTRENNTSTGEIALMVLKDYH